MLHDILFLLECGFGNNVTNTVFSNNEEKIHKSNSAHDVLHALKILNFFHRAAYSSSLVC